MLIQINFESDIPIYMQLREQIIIGIACAELQPGESLPSVRRMASDIGINLHTVNKAYSLLKEEGYISLDRRKGAEIATNIKSDKSFEKNLSEKLLPLASEAKSKQLSLNCFIKLASQAYEKLSIKGDDLDE